MKTEEQFQAWLIRQGKEKDRARPSSYYGDPAKHIMFANERRLMRGQELHNFCEQWRHWCRTRKLYLPPGASSPKNLLARFQPSRAGSIPDAELNSDIYWFNMAVHALADMKDPDLDCFTKFYWYHERNIKSVAHKMGIGRQTFYDRKNRFAERALSMSISLRATFLQSKYEAKDADMID